MSLGSILSDQDKSNLNGLECSAEYRGYWQVYWKDNMHASYKINKNNAQANVWKMDDGKELEITLVDESNDIRIDFKFTSGNAYFYAKKYY